MGKVCNGSKLVYLVHRSIIFDSCIILGMLIKGVTCETTPCLNVLTVMRLIKGWSVNASRHEISRASRRLLN